MQIEITKPPEPEPWSWQGRNGHDIEMYLTSTKSNITLASHSICINNKQLILFFHSSFIAHHLFAILPHTQNKNNNKSKKRKQNSSFL
ncbi:unnamed protein product [Trifolium pratense]|uniref:Uncharacterized protein n=1 Tax=Trifolium pratense TaxID=57577 RepID=A0ACB0IQV0_TRIPR|nr:unnamed protein product [Trifolium pratense]